MTWSGIHQTTGYLQCSSFDNDNSAILHSSILASYTHMNRILQRHGLFRFDNVHLKPLQSCSAMSHLTFISEASGDIVYTSYLIFRYD